MKDDVMVKINKYLVVAQLILLNLIGQNITQCAAWIRVVGQASNLDLELMDAASAGNKENVKRLIKDRANVNYAINIAHTNMSEDTAIILAARNGRKEIVELLLETGADINTPNVSGYTPLLEAFRNNHREIVELLIKSGAVVKYIDSGKIFSYPTTSSNYDNKEVFELLLKITMSLDLITASLDSNEKKVKELINKGANVNAANKYGVTALSLAAYNGHKGIAELLLKAGSDYGWEIAINQAKMIHPRVHNEESRKNKQEIIKMIENEPLRRDNKIIECQKIISNKISNLPNKPLVNDVITLISQYTISTYSDVIEFEKTNPNIIEMLLKANEQLSTVNNFKRKANADNDESDIADNKKARLSESAIVTLIAQLKEKKAALNKEIDELRGNIDNTALIESKEEEIVNINSEIESLEKSLNSKK